MQRLFQRRSSRKSARKDILATAPEIRGSMLMGPAALATEEKVLDEKQKLAVPLQQYQPKIYTDEEALKKYLQACSTEPPLAESYGCKDIDQCACVTFERYRRRYFVLYRGVLLYYSHKSHFDRDRKNGFKHSKRILLEDLYLTKPDNPSPDTRFSFYLHAPHKKNKREQMLIVVKNRQARHMWTEQLQSQNPLLVSPLHHHSKHHHHFNYH